MPRFIHEIIDDLPTANLTTRVLRALDWVAPGQWTNLTGFTETIRAVTGETDDALIQEIGVRAIALYNDPSQGYQRAMWLFEKIDSAQGIAGKLALVNKIGESVGFLGFLNRITPKADTLQVVDLALKLVVEVVTFCQINGLPGDSLGDFLESLSDYQHEARMRMAALVALDGVIPLGPDFTLRATDALARMGAGDLEGNPRFGAVREMLPGGDTAGQLDFMRRSLGGVSGWMQALVAERGLTPEKIAGSLAGFLSGAEGKLDYVAAFLDISTNYFEHTGAQTVARSLINRAVGEI